MPRSFADLKAIRSERRAAALRAQELGQLPRDVHARHGFDPNQPKVLAGFPTDGAWNAPTPPIAPSLSPTFPPASLKHLDSAKYWGAGPSSSGATEQLPVYGFYLSPVPQVPSWAAVLTHPAERASQIMAEPPDPTSWPTPAPPSSSPSGKIPGNLAQPDDTWEGRASDLLGSALALGAGGGILGNLGPSIGSWNSAITLGRARRCRGPRTAESSGVRRCYPHSRSRCRPAGVTSPACRRRLLARISDHATCPRCKATVRLTQCMGGRLQPGGPSQMEFNLPE